MKMRSIGGWRKRPALPRAFSAAARQEMVRAAQACEQYAASLRALAASPTSDAQTPQGEAIRRQVDADAVAVQTAMLRMHAAVLEG